MASRRPTAHVSVRRAAANSAYSLTSVDGAGVFVTEGDSMPDIQTERPMPSIVPCDVPAMSDDECLVRLAQAVREHDAADLDEVARLIARLAVTIE